MRFITNRLTHKNKILNGDYMNIFKRRKKIENISVDDAINFIKKHQKSLSQKCRGAYNRGDTELGRWWDCQACAIIDLIDELKNEFKE